MGWTELDRIKGISNKAFFQGEVGGEHLEILDAAQAGSICYLAARTPRGVIGLIAQYRWVPNANIAYAHNFGYKVEEEGMGPYSSRCPERILEALSPLADLYDTDSAEFRHARGWRESCWATIFAKRAKPQVKSGDVIRFSAAITFGNGMKGDTFTFLKRSTFRLDHSRVSIPRWRDNRDYEVVSRAAASAS
jgi:hypothetical protein